MALFYHIPLGMPTDLDWMRRAIEVAQLAGADCPIGAVIVRDNEEVSAYHNEVERRSDPTAHCELLVIQHACAALDTRYLQACTLYCTLEPCSMCAEAIRLAHIGRVVFGAFRTATTTPSCDMIGGIMMYECSQLLRNFFAKCR